MGNSISVEIKKHIGVLSTGRNGWTKELNIVSWNGNTAKYDVRDWDESHERMGKGIALDEENAKALYSLLATEFGGE